MRATFLRGLVLVFLATLFSGCSGDAVQEDRTISFGGDGVATFQHGSSGVFIDVGGETRTIFKPSEDVLATSSPLWSPDKKRVLFTVATPVGRRGNEGTADWDDTPDGRTFGRAEVQYDCFVYDADDADQPEPKKLFTKRVRHAGYVAANLAAKWSPDGNAIVFVSADSDDRHVLKAWDLQSNSESLVFPHSMRWLTFDFVPDSADLVVCAEGGSNGGIWIGSKQSDWWQVTNGRGPQQVRLATSGLAGMFATAATSDSPIERLRGLMPVWSTDNNRFAFITWDQPKQDEPANYAVHVSSLDAKSTKVLYESETPVSEVRWDPNQNALGIVRYDKQKPVLTSLSLADGSVKALSDRTVHQFAGWNSAGTDFAMVAPVQEFAARRDWAFVFAPTRPGREALLVSGSAGERELFAGTRITFPQWSPDGTEISFWATFTPTYQSWFNVMGGPGLRNGDPAAALNLETGKIRWMPVSAIEKLQIGHYYLLKGDADESMRWYDEAQPGLPESDESNEEHLLAGHLYRSICLSQLDRKEDADAAFALFLQNVATIASRAEPSETQQQKDLRLRMAAVVKYLMLVEVYASVDKLDECETRLKELMVAGGEPEFETLARTIALSQILLLQNRHTDYAALVGSELLPQAKSLFGLNAQAITPLRPEQPVFFATQLSLLPLFSPDYLSQLEPAVVARLGLEIESIRADGTSQSIAAGLDTLLVRLHTAANNAEAVSKTQTRLARNSEAASVEEGAIDNALKFARAFPDLSALQAAE